MFLPRTFLLPLSHNPLPKLISILEEFQPGQFYNISSEIFSHPLCLSVKIEMALNCSLNTYTQLLFPFLYFSISFNPPLFQPPLVYWLFVFLQTTCIWNLRVKKVWRIYTADKLNVVQNFVHILRLFYTNPVGLGKR